jgi:hypothetical protein
MVEGHIPTRNSRCRAREQPGATIGIHRNENAFQPRKHRTVSAMVDTSSSDCTGSSSWDACVICEADEVTSGEGRSGEVKSSHVGGTLRRVDDFGD